MDTSKMSVCIKKPLISACPSVVFGCCFFQNCLQIVSENRAVGVENALRPW